MPRGNDSQAAASELADRFSEGLGNAEELIIASNAERTPDLQAASMKKVDEEETLEAVEKLVGSKKGPDGSEILDAAVRGDDTVIVYKDSLDGRVRKALLSEVEDGGSGNVKDADKKKKAAKKQAKAKAKTEDAQDVD